MAARKPAPAPAKAAPKRIKAAAPSIKPAAKRAAPAKAAPKAVRKAAEAATKPTKKTPLKRPAVVNPTSTSIVLTRTRAAKEPKERVRAMTGYEPSALERTLTEDQYEMGLRPTATPGVYINSAGVLVDSDGVLLDYKDVKSKDDDRFARIIGEKADSPAKLLKAIALDPQQTLMTRMDAAKAAAPYFDRKKPIGLDGGEDGKPVEILVTHKLQGMSQTELDQFERLLKMTAIDEVDNEDAEDSAA